MTREPVSEPSSFTCPCCGAVSYHPDDVRHGWCGRCHAFTGDPLLGPPHLEGPCPQREMKALPATETGSTQQHNTKR